ncbi:MAG: acyltransferase family protein [Curtobacterium sp.]
MQTERPAHWRPDIQGLRAVAVVGVLVFHADAPWLSGGFAGVDVFFVISGFLITCNLLRERAATGSIRLVRFWIGRLVRLAPAALATIAATVGMAFVVLPPLDRITVRVDALAAALGIENLTLARTGTNYLAAHDVSPFQQFWSLGVEEQFYVGWALVLAAVCAVPFLRRHLGVIVVLLCAASLAAMFLTKAAHGPWAFFGPHARAWELGVGALVAVLSTARGRRRLPVEARPSRSALVAARTTAPAGIVLIAASFVLFDETTTYPGLATFVPVIGALCIVAPVRVESDPVRAVLGSTAFRWVGDRSYSLYLWHWPLLVIPGLALDRALTVPEVAGTLLATVALAWLSHRYLERGVAEWCRATPRRPVGIVVAGAAILAAVVPATAVPVLHTPDTVTPATPTEVLAGPRPSEVVPANVTPSLHEIAEDIPPVYGDACVAEANTSTPLECSIGAGDRTIVLFGDSHAVQWSSPLREYANAAGARLVVIAKTACPAPEITVWSNALGRESKECDEWRAAALERITEMRPDLVVVGTAGSRYADVHLGKESFEEAWDAGFDRTLGAFARADLPTAVLLDAPQWPRTPNRCVSRAIADVDACSIPTTSAVSDELVALDRLAIERAGATAIDPVPWLCTDVCSPVVWTFCPTRTRGTCRTPQHERSDPS